MLRMLFSCVAMPYRNIAPEGPALLYSCNSFVSSAQNGRYSKNISLHERCFGGLLADNCATYRWSNMVNGKKQRHASGTCTEHSCDELRSITRRQVKQDIKHDSRSESDPHFGWDCYLCGASGCNAVVDFHAEDRKGTWIIVGYILCGLAFQLA